MRGLEVIWGMEVVVGEVEIFMVFVVGGGGWLESGRVCEMWGEGIIVNREVGDRGEGVVGGDIGEVVEEIGVDGEEVRGFGGGLWGLG